MFAGFDFGTSGARSVVIDHQGNSSFFCQTDYSLSEEKSWKTALWDLIKKIPDRLRSSLQAIAIDGTSGTFLGCDPEGNPQTTPQLYNDDSGRECLEFLGTICPIGHLALSSTSTLARLVKLWRRKEWQQSWQVVHHCDRLAYFLHQNQKYTDYHNALKLGYDPIGLTYPHWLTAQPFGESLPLVVAPGNPIGLISFPIAEELGINPHCVICAGTTDSNAAYLAAIGGEFRPGVAVTSLGSTLTLKILCSSPIFAQQWGIYSHRWDTRSGPLWLAGGASNSGGAVLAHFFSSQELKALSQLINPNQPTGLEYYPLLKPGERFPHSDPDWQPTLSPRPPTAQEFLQGLLEGMSRIENLGYDRLQKLGAEPIKKLYTVGGGASNPVWTAIRQQHLPVPFAQPRHTEAAYGTALLAQTSWMTHVSTPQTRTIQ